MDFPSRRNGDSIRDQHSMSMSERSIGISGSWCSLFPFDVAPVFAVDSCISSASFQVICTACPFLTKVTIRILARVGLTLQFAWFTSKATTTVTVQSWCVGLDIRVGSHCHRCNDREASADQPYGSFHRRPEVHIHGIPRRVWGDRDGRKCGGQTEDASNASTTEEKGKEIVRTCALLCLPRIELYHHV